MPNTQSAKKRLRQDAKRRTINRSVKTSLRKQIRKVREAVAAGDTEKADAELRLAAQKLDKAGARNTIHANKAARLKSRLSSAVKAAKGK